MTKALKASWPVAIGWSIAGAALTGTTWTVAMEASQLARGRGMATIVQLVAAAGVVAAVLIGRRLPHRARAMFVTGLLTPILLAVALVVWLIWALAHSNITF